MWAALSELYLIPSVAFSTANSVSSAMSAGRAERRWANLVLSSVMAGFRMVNWASTWWNHKAWFDFYKQGSFSATGWSLPPQLLPYAREGCENKSRWFVMRELYFSTIFQNTPFWSENFLSSGCTALEFYVFCSVFCDTCWGCYWRISNTRNIKNSQTSFICLITTR